MMVLYGGRRSPFVRRVSVWLALQNQPFERRDVQVFGADFEGFLAISPLGRVPALVLSGGQSLIESAAIVDYLEDIAPADLRLIPPTGEPRRAVMHVMACANAVAEKAVALVYEVERRPAHYVWPDWQHRLINQVGLGLQALEAMLPPSGWCGGDAPNGADVTAVTAIDFVDTIASYSPPQALPRLRALSALANAREDFSTSKPSSP